MEMTTRLEIKTGVFVPVRILLDSNATAEERLAWESIVQVSIVSIGTSFAARNHPLPVKSNEDDPEYDDYNWYMAQKHSAQPLFTTKGIVPADDNVNVTRVRQLLGVGSYYLEDHAIKLALASHGTPEAAAAWIQKMLRQGKP